MNTPQLFFTILTIVAALMALYARGTISQRHIDMVSIDLCRVWAPSLGFADPAS